MRTELINQISIRMRARFGNDDVSNRAIDHCIRNLRQKSGKLTMADFRRLEVDIKARIQDMQIKEKTDSFMKN